MSARTKVGVLWLAILTVVMVYPMDRRLACTTAVGLLLALYGLIRTRRRW